jgi:sulfur carrier protein
MKVEVKLFAAFRKGRFVQKELEFPEGACLHDIFEQLNITAEEVSLPLINGVYSSVEDLVSDGDVLSIFPAVGGG